MSLENLRIALSFGHGYVPGLSAVVTGAVLAAEGLGWEIVGIHDGFEGLLRPGRYPDGGLVKLSRQLVEHFSGSDGAILGTAGRSDPFRARTVNSENEVEETDRSDEFLQLIRREKIDAMISVVGAEDLGIFWKLSRKGLKTICIPKSVENDMAATMLPFGFNSALSFVAEMLERARKAAMSARRIGVVEVLGEHAGWLALQAGMAVCADAILIPEIPYDLEKVAIKLKEKSKRGEHWGLVVVTEGAMPMGGRREDLSSRSSNPLKATLSPLATDYEGSHVIEQSGMVAETVALELQRLTDCETYPLVLGQLAKGGSPTVVDRQLGLGYGAGAVRALKENLSGVMVVFQPPDLEFVPITEALNKIRTVPGDCELVQLARDLGISLGD
jgi:ATP-dependent phosphofructokinase / diphosphate-dependent phosphofructokinase